MPPPPPPPPAPAKSSALKWILIGCGAFAFLGVLACGGCFVVGFLVLKGLANEAVAQVKPIITSNETVKAEVGEVKSVNLIWSGFRAEKRNGRDTLFFTVDVEGDKGRGTVEIKLYDRTRGTAKDEVYATLTFIDQTGNKRTRIGTWRIYDDHKGNAGFVPVDKPPPDGPPGKPNDSED
jgi:hypothetical protein